jgi:HEAT repeat protein
VGELEWLAAADPDAGVVDSGISGLAEIAARQGAAGEAAVDSLVGLFADPEKCERAAAAVARLPVAAVSRVANGLKHPQPTVRRRTVDALARYRRPEATRQLQTAFTDEDPRVREAAAVGVTRLGTRLFDETLKQIAQNDSSRSVRRAAAAALASQRAVN